MRLSTFSLFFILASVNADGKNRYKFESRLSTLSRVLSKTGAFDIESNQTINCIKETMKLYGEAKDLLELVDGILSVNFCDSENVCDLEGTVKYNETKSECGGKIVNQEISKCGQDWCLENKCTDGDIPADRHFVNVPVCMADVCADNTDYKDLLAAINGDSRMKILPLTIAGNCTTLSSAPSTVPSDEPSTILSSTPSSTPSDAPSSTPSDAPSSTPSDAPSTLPSSMLSSIPSYTPSDAPIASPSSIPSSTPSTVLNQISPSVPSTTEGHVGGHNVGNIGNNHYSTAQIRMSTCSFVVASTIIGILFSVI